MSRRDPAGRGEAALLAALVEGRSVREAASVSGTSEATVKRRLRDPRFLAELAAARQQALSRAVAALAHASTAAARPLAHLAEHAQQEHVQLGAARALLDLAFRGCELVDLAERISILEQRAQERRTA